MDSYRLNTASPSDRKEAFPIPLALVAEWERKVTHPQTGDHEVIFIGFILVLIYGGLRFGDGQRTKPESMEFALGALRGIAWLTKTSARGQPFACHGWGLTGTPHDVSWAKSYVQKLGVWTRSATANFGHGDLPAPDFLLPDLVRTGNQPNDVIIVNRPMSYQRALVMFRRLFVSTLISTPVSCEQAQNFTLHSCKNTLLSVARQLDVPDRFTAEMGHHRSSSGNSSIELYSRDDTARALRGQSLVVNAVRSGWRPMRAQARGGQTPLPQIPFDSGDALPADVWNFDLPSNIQAPHTRGRTVNSILPAPMQ